MKTDIEIFKQTPLFHNINENDLEAVVGCLDGIKRHYKKGILILSEGESQKRIGVILSGCIQISSEDVFGNRNIMEQLETGDMYGAAFACAGIKKSPVNVTAVQDSTMWFADVEKVDVTGISKGHGFAGTVKRWGTHRGPMTHGSHYHRGPGSLGACSDPSRVFKGKKLPGHYGVDTVTIQNLDLVKVDTERNLLLVKGSVPGPKGGLLVVKNAVKANA